MKITFHGAAKNVTGSKHLLEINDKKILLDCGLFQGHRKETEEWNKSLGFEAREIDAVVLSHSHIDHSGSLPLLVKNGFEGPIYCTHATRDLCNIMLLDSAYIQEKDAEWIKKKKKDPLAEPLYTIEDATKTLTQFRSVAYDQKFCVIPGVCLTFKNAGHLLGSAVEEWEIEEKNSREIFRLGFTGDLGRHDLPILKDPVQLTDLDALITESTYGNRLHDEIKDVEDQFAEAVNKAFDRGGKVFVPAFAVERTQEILYVIRQLQSSGKLPKKIPIFVDSPLATKATEIFYIHQECFDEELLSMVHRGEDPFFSDGEGLKFTRSVEESKSINDFPGSAIVISASGMCEAGRIRHHLVNSISDPKNLLLIVGFMAQNTLGRKLVDGENPVNIFGDPYEVRAEIKIFNAFSGHADQTDLLKFAEKSGNPKKVFLVHGEEESMKVFQEKLQKLPNLKKC